MSVARKSPRSSATCRTNSESSLVALPSLILLRTHCNFAFAGTTRWRSNTVATTVTTGLKIKTKQNGTRTHSTSAATLGRALLYKETSTRPSILRRLSPLLRTTQRTRNHNLRQVLLPPTSADIVGMSLPIIPRQTGQLAGATLLMYTSSENATKVRSSSGRIISDSISNIAMREPVGSGQTCLKPLA